MTLRRDFQFSQHNLQDYIECPQRFYLRYVEQRGWPALRSEPVQEQERHASMGVRFHEMIHQAHLGIDTHNLTAGSIDTDLLLWWQRYLDNPPAELPTQRMTEFTLSAAFAGYRLIAKYDLLAVQPGERVVIVDWKTSLRPPAEHILRARMQSRLYPLLVVLAGQSINAGKPVDPDQVEMIYWFASQPETPVHLFYSERQFAQDQSDLFELIRAIDRAAPEDFQPVGGEKTCVYCNYRSLCGRGERAGDWEGDDLPAADISGNFDLSDLGEIQF